VSLLILVVDDEPDVEVLFRQQFRRDLRAGRFVMNYADAPCPTELLCPRCERHRGRAAKERDKLAALHSMTSSAMERTPGGMVRPRTFAVLRLIANSYLAGS